MRTLLVAAVLLAGAGCATTGGASTRPAEPARSASGESPPQVALYAAGDTRAPRSAELIRQVTVSADPQLLATPAQARTALDARLRDLALASDADAVTEITYGIDVDHFEQLRLSSSTFWRQVETPVATAQLVKLHR